VTFSYYTHWRESDGEIMGSGLSEAEHIAANTLPGCQAAPGRYDAADGYFSAGQFVPYTLEQLQAKALRPDRWHQWSNVAMAWYDARDAAAIKAAKRLAIDEVRDNLAGQAILVGAITLDADPASRALLTGKIAAMQERQRLGISLAPELLVWRDADNVTHSWATDESYLDWLTRAALAIEERTTALYIAAWSLKEALDQLSTPADLAAFNVNAGWPA
jgi:hypothetical protein